MPPRLPAPMPERAPTLKTGASTLFPVSASQAAALWSQLGGMRNRFPPDTTGSMWWKVVRNDSVEPTGVAGLVGWHAEQGTATLCVLPELGQHPDIWRPALSALAGWSLGRCGLDHILVDTPADDEVALTLLEEAGFVLDTNVLTFSVDPAVGQRWVFARFHPESPNKPVPFDPAKAEWRQPTEYERAILHHLLYSEIDFRGRLSARAQAASCQVKPIDADGCIEFQVMSPPAPDLRHERDQARSRLLVEGQHHNPDNQPGDVMLWAKDGRLWLLEFINYLPHEVFHPDPSALQVAPGH